MMFLRRLLFWAIAIVFPLPLMITYDMTATDPVAYKQLALFGMLAYNWWLLAILLSARPRWVDRLVGLPAIYGFHGMLGLLAVIFAFIHADRSYTSVRLARTLGDWALYGAIATLFLAVFFLSGWLVDRSQLLMRLKRRLEQLLFRHQLSVWLHRANLVILVMIWVHVHIIWRVNHYFWFMMLFDLYTVGVLSVYAWKKWVAPAAQATGTIVTNDALRESTRRIQVELKREDPRIQPGDFFFLRFEGTVAVHRERHPFSATDDDQRRLTFTIRQHGNYTRRLGGVALGTRVRVEGPFGRFASIVERLDPETPIVLLGMGAGVAPLLSLTAAHHRTRRLHLLWSVKTAGDAYYRDQIVEYHAAARGRLRVSGRVGRFTHDHLAELLTPQEIAEAAFFIVGPNAAVLANQRLLRRLGVARSRIHQERLTM